MKRLLEQIAKFGVVGVLAFFTDYISMIILTELIGIPYLISTGLAFCISVIANYILSMKFVFQPRKDTSKAREFILFLVMSIIGLGLTEVLMYFAVDDFHIDYRIAKIGVTAIVMVYNFISRKLLLEAKNHA